MHFPEVKNQVELGWVPTINLINKLQNLWLYPFIAMGSPGDF